MPINNQNTPKKESNWYVYMVRCIDNTYYTGITTDLDRRVNEHNSLKKGARYTRARRPVLLVYSEEVASRSLAAKREYKIRKFSVAEKKAMISTYNLPDRNAEQELKADQ